MICATHAQIWSTLLSAVNTHTLLPLPGRYSFPSDGTYPNSQLPDIPFRLWHLPKRSVTRYADFSLSFTYTLAHNFTLESLPPHPLSPPFSLAFLHARACDNLVYTCVRVHVRVHVHVTDAWYRNKKCLYLQQTAGLHCWGVPAWLHNNVQGYVQTM